jgi:hypothetical protein
MPTLEDFRNYVTDSGVNFDELSNDKKGEWRERFDKSRGKLFLDMYMLSCFIHYLRRISLLELTINE